MSRELFAGLAGAVVLGLLSIASVARPGQTDSRPREHGETITLSTDLVLLSVSVSDRKGAPVSGLTEGEFAVYEDGVRQELSFFDAGEVAVSWGLVLDRSASMDAMIEDVHQAALHVLDEGTNQDEFFVVAFSKRPELVSEFTRDRRALGRSLQGLRADGSTALWDATVRALEYMQQRANHRKRVLVVLTDGEDNASATSFRQLLTLAEEEETLVYVVGMFDPEMDDPFGSSVGPSPVPFFRRDLERLAERTGAAAHFPENLDACKSAMKAIAREVRLQYSLGYYPTNRRFDGRWRTIRVVAGQGGRSKALVVRTRAGYFAASVGSRP